MMIEIDENQPSLNAACCPDIVSLLKYDVIEQPEEIKKANLLFDDEHELYYI